MPIHKILKCCNNKIDVGEVWFLKDFKGYTARKLYIGKCSICGDDAALQIMTNTETGITYHNLYNGIEAVKTIYREKKRKIKVFENIKSDTLYGWIYGINTEIKNKKGEVTKIKRFRSDFSGNKKCIETEYFK